MALALGTCSASLCPIAASAQSLDLMVIPLESDRGRNQSVTERPRPEYDARGIDVGGFRIDPRVDAVIGYSDNVYQSATPVDSAFALVAPRIDVNSNWSVNKLGFDASGRLVRYFSQPARNEDGWSVGANGKIELGPDASITANARTSRVFETPFQGNGIPIARSALPVQISTFQGLFDKRFSRLRVAVSGDYGHFNYLPVIDFAGVTQTRDARDRDIARVAGHVEYGISPTSGVFIQSSYGEISYRLPLLPGVANRDSQEFRVLGGISFDVSALVRGSVAVGYAQRRYRSPLYNDISGVSVDAKVDYFPTELTTVSLAAHRKIEDSNVGSASGYFNNGVQLAVDHELLRNLILSAAGEYERDVYRNSPIRTQIFSVSGGGKLYVDRSVQIIGTIRYRERDSNSGLIGPNIGEFTSNVGVSLRY